MKHMKISKDKYNKEILIYNFLPFTSFFFMESIKICR